MKGIKKNRLYREGRYIWRSFVVYKRPFSYLWHRFFVGPRIRNVKHPLDRPVETSDYSLHILCSHKDVTMLLWSLGSWYKVLAHGMAGQVYVHEDGSFTKQDSITLQRVIPDARIIYAEVSSQKAKAQWLENFPELKKFRLRKDIPLMAKLVDPYFTGEAKFKIIMDSDIVWFKKPDELFDLLSSGRSFATDSYKEMVGAVAKGLSDFMRRFNSGVVGYEQKNFNFDSVEKFLGALPPDFYGHHVEQAAYAHALSDAKLLPFERYSLKPKKDLVMRHYTGPVREKFWFEGVKRVKGKIH